MEQHNESLFTKFNNWVKESMTLKLFLIGILILLLLIPTSMINSLIWERQVTSESVIREISSNWGSKQIINGPVLAIPYRLIKNEREEKGYVYFLPDELNITGNIIPQERKIGIYKMIVYTSVLDVIGTFRQVNISEWNIPESNMVYEDARLITGLSDLRGIKESISLSWNSTEQEFEPGVGNITLFDAGIGAKVPVLPDQNTYAFSFQIKLNGSEGLQIMPLGKTTSANLSSSWKDPAFGGAFLPESHVINENGFEANWKVLHFNRNFPQQWLSSEKYALSESSAFGVDLLLPLQHYQKSHRSAKYAILIISLTFLLFFFIEIMNHKRIHPLQYILVGIALTIFYSLLISLSEHLGFNQAYLLSAVATISLISVYMHGIFQTFRLSILTAGIMTLLYGYIFIILQLQDYALLAGSIGLFVAIAVVMVFSRKINWYKPAQQGI